VNGCKEKKIENLTNKLFHLLNKLTNTSDSTRITNISNELLETLKTVQNCTSCKKDNIKENYFHESINEIEHLLVELENEERGWRKNDIINKFGVPCKLFQNFLFSS